MTANYQLQLVSVVSSIIVVLINLVMGAALKLAIAMQREAGGPAPIC